MRRIIVATIFAALAISIDMSGQSAVSNSIVFTLEDENYIFMPPELYVDIDFQDENGNRILEAEESGSIILNVRNFGGRANGVKVSVLPERRYKGMIFDATPRNISLAANETATVQFHISAGIDIPTDSLRFSIRVSEPMGYDFNAALVLSTFEYLKSKISVQGVQIIDAGKGLRAKDNNPDGKIQKGEVVRAVVTIQNIGIGEANDVAYEVKSNDPNVHLMTDDGITSVIRGNLESLLAGEAKEISFRLSASNNYTHWGGYLPIYISVSESKHFGDIASVNVPIPLGASPAKTQLVDIKGEREKLLALHQTKVYSSSDRISSSIKIRDISVAPAGEPQFNDAVAIVIGAEKNSYGVAPAPYAARDAQVMAKYFKTSLGVRDVRLLTNENVTGNALSDLLDPRFGHLSLVVKPGQTDVFVYYSGHGMPDLSQDGGQDIYLFPYDARKELVKERGYSLNKLYADLNSLNAKSVTVILDACFSGSSRQTAMYQSENISNTKGVVIAMPDMLNRPWVSNPSFRVFTSSSGNQTSLGYDQSQTGLFTYYIALGLQGEADENKDGSITMNELVGYVTDNVSKEAKNIRGGAQTPQFYGNGDFVLEVIK